MAVSISGEGVISGSSSYSFDSNVSIAGTTTIEDVTSVDSVGIITAQSGIHVTGGELLIGRTSKPNDQNTLVVSGPSPADVYDNQIFLEGDETTGAINTGGALTFGGHDGTSYRNWANIRGMKENGISGNTAAYMSFHTRAAGGAPVERLRITSAGDITASNTQFTTHVHQEYTGFNASNSIVNYLLVCPTTNTDIRFVGTIMTGRTSGTSGVGGGMIDVALIGSNSGVASAVDYTIRSMSTSGSSYVGPQGQWCTIDFGGTTYFAIRFSSSASSMWGTSPQHCSFNGYINNCTPVGKNTSDDTLTNETILTDAKGRHTFQNTYVGINKRNPAQALDVVGRISKTEYEPGEIIEQISSFCDGSSHTVKSGTYTMTNVTANQAGTTSDATASGSTISYTPPLGTKRIHYQYWFKWEATENSGISHFWIQVDGNDVVISRRTKATNYSRYSNSYYHHGENWSCMNCVLECDASSTDTSEGQYAGWAANQETKDIRVRFREYNSSYEIQLHRNQYWDGASASGTNQQPIKPMLIVTAMA